MRRFEVWLDKCVPRCERSVVSVELPDTATDAECDKACGDVLDTMIANELDTGWNEILPKKKAKP